MGGGLKKGKAKGRKATTQHSDEIQREVM